MWAYAVVNGGLIVLILLIVLHVRICNYFSEIANTKGYSDRRSFWLTFFLMPIGMLYVVALPDLNLVELQKKANQLQKEMIDLLKTESQNREKQSSRKEDEDLVLPIL